MAGLINLRLLTDFFNKIGPLRISLQMQTCRFWGQSKLSACGWPFFSRRRATSPPCLEQKFNNQHCEGDGS